MFCLDVSNLCINIDFKSLLVDDLLITFTITNMWRMIVQRRVAHGSFCLVQIFLLGKNEPGILWITLIKMMCMSIVQN